MRKEAISCADDQIDAVIQRIRTDHPDLTITEKDEASFNAAQMTPVKTQAQKDWAAFKASSPTQGEMFKYFAKYLGLE